MLNLSSFEAKGAQQLWKHSEGLLCFRIKQLARARRLVSAITFTTLAQIGVKFVSETGIRVCNLDYLMLAAFRGLPRLLVLLLSSLSCSWRVPVEMTSSNSPRQMVKMWPWPQEHSAQSESGQDKMDWIGPKFGSRQGMCLKCIIFCIIVIVPFRGMGVASTTHYGLWPKVPPLDFWSLGLGSQFKMQHPYHPTELRY